MQNKQLRESSKKTSRMQELRYLVVKKGNIGHKNHNIQSFETC